MKSDLQEKNRGDREEISLITDRIEEIRSDIGLTKSDFCQLIGFPYKQYSDITGPRGVKPSLLLVQSVVTVAGVSAEWLIGGRGPKYSTRDTVLVRPDGRPKESGDLASGDYVLIPRYTQEASAGVGAAAETEEVRDWLAFRVGWIKSALGGSAQDFMAMIVRGNSMEPFLHTGDTVLIDRRDTTAAFDGGVYVLTRGEGVMVKRVQRLADGRMVLKSDNTSYREEVLGAVEMQDGVNIVGRVVWFARHI